MEVNFNKEFLKELTIRTEEILYYIWDPIQISSYVRTRDEYISYSSKVVSFVLVKDYIGLDEYLTHVVVDRMGTGWDSRSNSKTIEMLQELRDYLSEKHELSDDLNGTHNTNQKAAEQ